MGIIAAGQITVVDLSDAPVLNTFITASRPTTQTYSKDSHTYKPSYASTPQVLTLKVTKAGSTANIIDSISSLHWFVVDGPIKTEIKSKDNSANEYISGAHNEILTTKLDIDLNKGSKRYEVMGIWPDPSTGLDVQFGGYIDLLLTQNGATGPQGPQGNTGNGIANTVITYGLSMSDTTEPATWSSEMPTLVKGMYLWTRTVIIYTNGNSTTSYQISYIAKDADATAEIDKAKQELLEKLETVRDDSLEAVDEAKQQLVAVRDESLAAAEEAKQGLINVNTKVDNAKEEIDKAKQDLANVASELNTAKQDLTDSVTAVNNKVDNAKEELTQAKQDLVNVASELNTAKQDLTDSVSAVNTKVDNAKAELTQAKQQLTTVSDDLSKAKTDFQNAVSAVDTKATNLKSDLAQAKQDLASQAHQLQEQASAQSELTNRVSSVEETANGTKTTVRELSKTVAQNGKDITSVTARTKVVEDDLAGTKTTLSQVQTTADSTSQKTATLETGLNGLSAKFDNLRVGGRNLLSKTNQGKTNWSWSVSSGGTTAEDFDVDGINAVKLTRTSDASISWDYIQYRGLIRNLIEPNTKYTLSFDVKPSVDVTFWAALKRGDGGSKLTNGVAMNKATANQWNKVSCVLTSNKTLPDDLSQVVYLSGMPTANGNWLIIKNIKLEKGNIVTDYSPSEVDLEQKVAEYKQNADQNYASLQTTVQNLDGTVQHNKTVADQTAQGFTTRIESLETYKDGESTRANQYFELAKTETARQLTAERTAIAKDYVAKSTYTSDVTGIRNDLTATTTTANTTKTNLANYQASNDRAVANLQSNLQTANGNISRLQTKVEAVPGQITSAVSAVEGKIPKSVGGRNLIIRSQIQNGYIDDNGNLVTATTQFTTGFIDGTKSKQFVITAPKFAVGDLEWLRLAKYDASKNFLGRELFRYDSNNDKTIKTITLADNVSYFKISFDGVYKEPFKIERGNVATDWSPAPEDDIEEISSLSSQIKQTADGMTLLATKTELNTTKNELQSGITTATNKANSAQNKANNNAQTINTHTTQISALNTGLQAKVSQTEFNTLSGRVTTAENNITAKANELSSKITSVEGKIPTNIGTVNLIKQSTAQKGIRLGANGGTFTDSKHEVTDWIKIEPSTVYTLTTYEDVSEPDMWYSMAFYSSNADDYSGWISRPTGAASAANLKGGKQYKSPVNATYAKVSYPIKYSKVKLERGNIATDYNPAPEDTAEQISNLSSEIKQTADGVTLLATKTELNTAKNELQSGINTATNKANAAQNTANNAQNKANSNAQTISTHTTQISALNTGLQAKVSQSEFNTLSGRVTTAENNITAKANELSSKITSVEGKIPTSVGGRNLLSKTNQGKLNWSWSVSSGGTTAENYDVNGINAVKLTRTSDASFSWDYIQYKGLIRKLIEPNTKYTLSFDVKPSVDVTFSVDLKRGDGGATLLTKGVMMNKATANQWNKVSCVLTSKTTLPDDLSQVVYLSGMSVIKGNYLIIKNIKLEKGTVSSDWSPAPEDTIEQIDAVSSELKQTKDGITLLATKTELNTAKSDLQSGITTATNKANSAQNKANSNAQTISTHTTQISALNTGLQAKVSQTDFNTLSGRVTTAENNITAKANELTSKITSVEGKIPTSIGGRNLWIQSKTTGGFVEETLPDNHITGQKKCYRIPNNAEVKFNIEPNFSSRLYRKVTFSAWVKYENVVQGENSWSKFNCFKHELVRKNSSTGATTGTDFLSLVGFTGTSDWKYITYTYDYSANKSYDQLKTSIRFNLENARSGTAWVTGVKIEIGSIPSDYSPAPEDTATQISNLSSEIKQTADGMTLLATKTELNNAKTELQSGINTATNKANSAQNTANNNAQTISTHTTQISALNTGLQAKVSQTDFNKLSGRVTSAENNITAKANELSSKISSVEGKIPTSVGGRNLLAKTNQGKTNWSWSISSGGATAEDYNVDGVKAVKLTRTTSASASWDYIQYRGLIRNLIEPNTKYTLSFDVKPNVDVTFWAALKCSNGGAPLTNGASMNKALANQWTKVSCVLTTTTLSDDLSQVVYLSGMPITNGNWLIIKNIKLEKGVVSSDWSPAPEDAIEEISSLSSELKQTADGMTLLATKTELNTAKNELQSGINTATNKANNAQNKANSNAQTISTHTTQISALNTGLQAKVSQTDFNTLSGRVTTAENNITAKANELSSKITSVEGKIPTNIGTVNLIKQSTAQKGLRLGTDGETYTDSKHELTDWIKVEPNTTYTLTTYEDVNEANLYYSLAWYSTNNADYSGWISRPTGAASAADLKGGKQYKSPANAKYAKVSYPTKYSKVKLERGNIATDYNSSPEDYDDAITQVKSEIKQTADGMTLLATKTELNSAKNELQSGINTANNKANSAQSTANAAQNTANNAQNKANSAQSTANAAQNTANSAQNKANSNAQTISTHTTQISALNTGLQAKVSQTDFNTLSGRVTTAENNITAKANELSSKITSVEGKIPTSSGGRNLAQGTSKDWSKPFTGFSGIKNTTIGLYRVLTDGLVVGDTIKTRIVLKYTDIRPASGKTAEIWLQGAGNVTEWNSGAYPSGGGGRRSLSGSGEIVFELTDKIIANHLKNSYWSMSFRTDWIASGSLQWRLAKVERGMFFTDWSPAPEDTISQINAVSSELKQTKDGITLLATKTELNTAKNELQSGISTATNKANAAQNTANNAQSTANNAQNKANAAQNTANNAQNKANSNAQTISTHTTQISALNTGLSAKVSQSDFNTLSGRVTTAENNITAKANELSSKITSVEGKIPTNIGTVNLIKQSTAQKGLRLGTDGGTYTDSKHELTDWIKIEPSTVYTLTTYEDVNEANMYYSLAWYSTNNADYSGRIDRPTGAATAANLKGGKQYRAPANAKYAKVSYPTKYAKVKLERGNVASDWSPSPEDTKSDINAVSSELKQTTDAIKASVTSLDKSTVKSSSLTINSDGIVMKAGKSTTDVANAIGSYFAVNQNAINLFSDKINVKGNMIVNGTITGDKIKASSVDVSKIVGIDANFIKSKIEYAMIDWLKGKTITAYNDNMTIDLQNGRISFKDGSNAVYRQTPDGIHTGFLHFEAGPQGGIQAAFGATSMREFINSKTSAFAGIRCYRVSAHGDSHEAKIDKIELIGDVVQFGHGYASEGNIGGGFIMDNAIYREDKPYSLNRMVRSIESLWRILHDHARNVGYNLSDQHFINALNDEYNAWYDMHNK